LGMGMLSSCGFVALLHHRARCWTLPSRGARGDAHALHRAEKSGLCPWRIIVHEWMNRLAEYCKTPRQARGKLSLECKLPLPVPGVTPWLCAQIAQQRWLTAKVAYSKGGLHTIRLDRTTTKSVSCRRGVWRPGGGRRWPRRRSARRHAAAAAAGTEAAAGEAEEGGEAGAAAGRPQLPAEELDLHGARRPAGAPFPRVNLTRIGVS